MKARYPGQCDLCGGRVRVGDSIKRDPEMGDWVHSKCPEQARDPYAHWNEEAQRVRYAETDFNSPYADCSDEWIKQRVYETWDED